MEHKYDVISHLQHTFSNAIFLLHFLDPLWMANILFDLNMYARFSSISKLVNWVISDPMVHKHCVKSVQIRSFFLVHIFPHFCWIRARKNSVFGHFSRSKFLQESCSFCVRAWSSVQQCDRTAYFCRKPISIFVEHLSVFLQNISQFFR